MLKRSLLCLLFISFLSACQASHLEIFPDLEDPSLVEQKLPIAAMSQDIDALVEGALQRHPNLSLYAQEQAIRDYAEELKKQLTQPMNRVEFFRVIGKLSHVFNDGHAFLLWPYQEFNALRDAGKKPFPFQIKISAQGQMLLAKTYKHDSATLPAGAQISSVNGIPAATLIAQMQEYVGGETELLRTQIIAERFPIMLWAVYGFLDQFELEIDTQQVAITGEQEWHSQQPEREAHYYAKLNATTGYLYLSHFDIDPDDFEGFVDKTFAQIKSDGVHSLVIDVRDNPGGNTDTVTYLSRYLANKPFRLVASVQEKLNQDNRGWFDYKGEVGEITFKEWDDWEQPIDSNNRFTGETYLLIGPITYSAAIVFATTLQDSGFATLIGVPTGGYANQSAQGNLFNLPNSQLRAYITTRLLVRPSGDSRQGHVIPDHLAQPTADSIAQGHDVAIEKALSLANNETEGQH